MAAKADQLPTLISNTSTTASEYGINTADKSKKSIDDFVGMLATKLKNTNTADEPYRTLWEKGMTGSVSLTSGKR